MASELPKNRELVNDQGTATLYDKLSRLHLEIASIYAELAASKPRVRSEERTVPIKSKSGRLLANLKLTENEAKVEVVSHLPTKNAPCSWLKNHLKAMEEKNEAFHFRLGEKDHVLEFIEVEGNITSDLARELESAINWAFSRMALGSIVSSESESIQTNRRTQTQEHFSKAEKGSNE